MKNKGQSSTEYMMMMGLSFLAIMIVLVVAFYMTTSTTYQTNVNIAVQTVDTLKMHADYVYIHGHPTTTTVKVTIPQGTSTDSTKTYAMGKTINIGLESRYGYINDIYAVTRGDICGGELPNTQGYYVFIIESTEDGCINISRK